MGTGASARRKRLVETATYVGAVMDLAEAALSERPLDLAPERFAVTFQSRIKESGAVEKWLQSAFESGIEKHEDLDEFLSELLNTHLDRFAVPLAKMLLWEVQAAVLRCTGKTPLNISMGAANAKTAEVLAAEARDHAARHGDKSKLEQIWILEKSVSLTDDFLKTIAKELADEIRSQMKARFEDIKRVWTHAFDPRGLGKLNAVQVSGEMLYANAQTFAGMTYDRHTLLAPMNAALEKVVYMSETVPNESVQRAVKESVEQLRRELDAIAQVRDVNRLLHSYVFPLACASPFLMPLAREQDYADAEVLEPQDPPRPPDNEPQVLDTAPPDDEDGDLGRYTAVVAA